jgi:hypothetical protein
VTLEKAEVQVIAPNIAPDETLVALELEDGIDLDAVRVVGYPKYLFDYHAELERKFISDREVELSITVDALTGGRLRNDVYPDLETRTIAHNALLQPRLDRDAAAEKARSVMRRYISFHFSTFVMVSNLPPMEITREDFVFTLYWLVPTGETVANTREVTIVDSVSGDVVEENVELDAVEEQLVS